MNAILQVCVLLLMTVLQYSTYAYSLDSNSIEFDVHSIIAVDTLGLAPENGLILYYPFNSNFNDQSGYGNNPEVSIDPNIIPTLTRDRFNNNSSAVYLNGGQGLRATVYSAFSTKVLTLSAWINVTGSEQPNPRIIAIGPWGTSAQYYSIILEGTSSARRLWYFTSSLKTNAYSSSYITNNSGWHHVAVVDSGSIVKFFIDGKLDSSAGVSGTLANFSTAILQVGYSDSQPAADRFIGSIDEVRVYNRALSDSEVYQVYADGSTNGSCGSSNGQSFSSAPSSGLCNSGTTSSVTGYGPWYWSCAGSNGGSTASCSASKKEIINGICGSSNGQSFSSAPTSGLCNSGTTSSVTGYGPWYWTCAGSSNGGSSASCSASKIDITIGSCGSSNGQSFSSAPTSGLCNSGTTSSVTGYGPWYWSCAGSNGGSTASCSASKKEIINGICGSSNGQSFSSAPTSGLCNSGTTSSVTGYGPWYWTCAGSSNGGSSASCSASKIDITIGSCGSSNGQSFSSAPTSGLCNSGTTSSVTGYGPWYWSCAGSNGGSSASCFSAPFVPADPVVTLITYYYQSILGRAPEPGGVDYYEKIINQAKAKGCPYVKSAFKGMAYNFFSSPEYLNKGTSNTKYVTTLYLTFLQRDPENDGLAYYLDLLARGVTRNSLLDNFVNSPEFDRFINNKQLCL
ncbi:hypothetical protein CCP4SC76_6310002 [Gammaproteobacteria bacterium]